MHAAVVVPTVGYSAAFFAVGMALASLGPALLELAEQTGSSLSALGAVFAVRSAGYLAGSGVGGPALDSRLMRGRGNRMLALSMLTAGASMAAVPLVRSVAALAALVFTQGVAMGVLDTGGNVMLLWVFDDIRDANTRPEPYMQTLHFAFALGAFVAPVLVGLTGHDISLSFTAMGLVFVPVALFLWLAPSPRHPDDDGAGGMDRAEAAAAGKGAWARLFPHRGRARAVVVLTALFLFLYVGAEVSAGGFIYTYAVRRGLSSERNAALINGAFWGSLALGRLAAIPLSAVASADSMLLGNLVGCTLSTALVLAFDRSVPALVAGVCGFGLFMASSFPSAILVAEQYLGRVSGNAAAWFVFGASFGEMFAPLAVLGLFHATDSYLALFWSLLALSLLAALAFAALRRYRPDAKRGAAAAASSSAAAAAETGEVEFGVLDEDDGGGAAGVPADGGDGAGPAHASAVAAAYREGM